MDYFAKHFKTLSFFILLAIACSLSSCEAIKGLAPSFGSSETNSATSNDSAQLQVKPNMALSATGDSKSNQGSVDKSTTNKTDTNNDAQSSTGAKNALNLTDHSKNENISKTDTNNGNNDNDKINGNQINNNNITEYQLIIIIAGSVVAGVIFGLLIPTRRQNKTYDRLLDYYLSNNKVNNRESLLR